MTDEERFFAWLDGELTAAEAAEMEARVAADPKLAELAERHRGMQARLKGAFDPVATAPVPERLVAATRAPGAEVVDLVAAKQARETRQIRRLLPQWAAAAAVLAVGILIGTMVPQRTSAPVQIRNGQMYAAATLDHALDTQLASAPGNAPVRIGITFRNPSGAICRSFAGQGASGMACRDKDRWQVRGLFAAPEGQSSDYRMAAGMDPSLAALIDSTMAGEPLDAADEKAAKERGWR